MIIAVLLKKKNMLHSKLSKSAYFYSILIVIFPFVMIFLINKFLSLVSIYNHWGIDVFVVVLIILSLFVVLWGFFVEMNMRMSVLSIDSQKVVIRQLLGYGSKRVVALEDIDGFITKGFRVRGVYQEYCYLIKNNRAIAVFSSAYYENYTEVRNKISECLTFLG